MTTAAASTAAPAKRRLPLRFSLRVLLLAVTAFAIGFPIWYRWPYEEAQEVSIAVPVADPFAPAGSGKSISLKRTLVTTWQRRWGGGRWKHGSERLYDKDKLISEKTYRDGELQGPYQVGALIGQFEAGKKDGIWAVRDEQGSERRSAVWRDGRLDGLFQFTENEGQPNARRRELVFSLGQLLSIDGQAVNDRLGKLVATGDIPDPTTAQALLDETNVHFIQTPLGDLADFLMVDQQVPIVVDSLHADRGQPITGRWRGMHFSSALTALAAEHGLACDYRYGLIWVTSASDGRDWHDPTGVSNIVPPDGSQLAACWNEPANVESIDLPLDEVLKILADTAGFQCNTSAIASLEHKGSIKPVTLALRQHPLRHLLGILLYQTRCRCKMEGETLVILPPERE